MQQKLARLIQRHNTAAIWTRYNPILLLGEIGFETDTHRFKVGDGETPWEQLDYYTRTTPYQFYSAGNGLILDKFTNQLTAILQYDTIFYRKDIWHLKGKGISQFQSILHLDTTQDDFIGSSVQLFTTQVSAQALPGEFLVARSDIAELQPELVLDVTSFPIRAQSDIASLVSKNFLSVWEGGEYAQDELFFTSQLMLRAPVEGILASASLDFSSNVFIETEAQEVLQSLTEVDFSASVYGNFSNAVSNQHKTELEFAPNVIGVSDAQEANRHITELIFNTIARLGVTFQRNLVQTEELIFDTKVSAKADTQSVNEQITELIFSSTAKLATDNQKDNSQKEELIFSSFVKANVSFQVEIAQKEELIFDANVIGAAVSSSLIQEIPLSFDAYVHISVLQIVSLCQKTDLIFSSNVFGHAALSEIDNIVNEQLVFQSIARLIAIENPGKIQEELNFSATARLNLVAEPGYVHQEINYSSLLKLFVQYETDLRLRSLEENIFQSILQLNTDSQQLLVKTPFLFSAQLDMGTEALSINAEGLDAFDSRINLDTAPFPLEVKVDLGQLVSEIFLETSSEALYSALNITSLESGLYLQNVRDPLRGSALENFSSLMQMAALPGFPLGSRAEEIFSSIIHCTILESIVHKMEIKEAFEEKVDFNVIIFTEKLNDYLDIRQVRSLVQSGDYLIFY